MTSKNPRQDGEQWSPDHPKARIIASYA